MLVLPPQQEEVLLMEGVGALVWQLLADPVEESELFSYLAEQFDVSFTEVRELLLPFLARLLECGAACRT